MRAPRPRDERVDRRFGPILFFVFIAAGAAFIAGGKSLDWSPFWVTGIPVGLMLLYALCVSALPIFRLRADQAGDNLYYLGFLYTLTSLGVSLYQFGGRDFDLIVRNFGVAVASTIAGVALRVVFNQMRRDPVEVEQESRLELAEAARRLKRELDGAAVEFAYFRRGLQQSIGEGFEEMRVSLKATSEKILTDVGDLTDRAAVPITAASENSGAAIERLAQTVAERLETASGQSTALIAGLTDTLTRHLEGATTKLADENAKLTANTAAISAALGDTAARLAAMQTPDKVIEISLAPAMDRLTELIAQIGARLDTARAVEDAAVDSLFANAGAQATQTLAIEALTVSIAGLAAALEGAGPMRAGADARTPAEGEPSGDAALAPPSGQVPAERLTASASALIETLGDGQTQRIDRLIEALEASSRRDAALHQTLLALRDDLALIALPHRSYADLGPEPPKATA